MGRAGRGAGADIKNKVQVIVLNGTSSSGKSTLARQLQATLPDPWLTLGVDTFIETLPSNLFSTEDGIILSPDGGVQTGKTFNRLQTQWNSGVAAMIRAGTQVILDEVFLDGQVSQAKWQLVLHDLNILWIKVYCAPEITDSREKGRSDRIVGMARTQAALVHINVAYDLEVDTGQNTSLECAQKVMEKLY